MPEASPFWQNAFLFGIFVVLGWGAWSGWRTGVARALMSLGGILAGGFAGLTIGGFAGSFFGRWLPFPSIFLGTIVGILTGLTIYFVTWGLGALFFKRTSQQRTGLLRFFFGVGGAIVGFIVSMTIVWGALFFIRSLGGFYEARFLPVISTTLPKSSPVVAQLVKLKRSIEAGSTGRQLISIDIVPEGYYRIFHKLGELCVRPAAVTRFLEYPDIADTVRDPKIAAIISDPEACEAARAQSVGRLMRNLKLIDASNDPDLIAKLQKIDIEKALDYALNAPEPTPYP